MTAQTIIVTDLFCHGMALLAVGQTFQISMRAGKIAGRKLGRGAAEIQQQYRYYFIHSIGSTSEQPPVSHQYGDRHMHEHDQIHNDGKRFMNNVPVMEYMVYFLPQHLPSFENKFLPRQFLDLPQITA